MYVSNVKSPPIVVWCSCSPRHRGIRDRQTDADREGARPSRAWLHEAQFIGWYHACSEQAPVVWILDELEIHHLPVWDDDRGEVNARTEMLAPGRTMR